MSASPAASAVIRIGDKPLHRRALHCHVGIGHALDLHRGDECATTIMIPLRVAIPNSVMKPIIDATEQTPPGEEDADHPADQRQRQVHHHEQRIAGGRTPDEQQDEMPITTAAPRSSSVRTPARRSRTAHRTRSGSRVAGGRLRRRVCGCLRPRSPGRGRRRCT